MQKPDYDCVFCLTRALHMCGNGMYSGMKKAWEKLAEGQHFVQALSYLVHLRKFYN
jgi:hypothetical protein